MNKKIIPGILLFSFFLFLSTALKAQSFISTSEGEPYPHNVNFTHLKLNVKFEPEKGLVKGTVTHYFKPIQKQVDTIFFNGIKMNVSKAMVNGKDAKFLVSDKGVIVFCSPVLTWNTADSISITYTCNPRKGIYFIGWNDSTNRCRKQIWTQGEGEDNRNWIPMYDGLNDKMTTEMIVEFPKKYKVLSNGKLISEKENTDGTKTWNYRMTHPHSTYLIMLGIGDYEIEHRKTINGTPVNLYYYPDQKDRMLPTYKYATECIDYLEQQTGVKFPWESYSQIPVADFMYGAMENTTATIYGDFLLNDARGSIDNSYVGVDVHELTHQWFGDFVTGRSWKQIWLQESYATYYPKIFTRKLFGNDLYEWNRRNEHRSALSFPEKDNLPIVHPGPGTGRIYQKGSAVIDMLNYVYGEETWQRVINYYLRHHAYSNVETNDLYQAFQDTAGIVPDWFFNEWLYKGGEPNYKVSYKAITVANQNSTEITVEQLQQKITSDVGLFKMPIVLQVFYTDGSNDSAKVWVTEAMQNFSVSNPQNKAIRFVLFDPGSCVLKKITFDKSENELLAQVQFAPHLIDRYDAAVALRSVSISKKREALINQFYKEKFHAVKAEIVSQLANDDDKKSVQLLSDAMNDKATEVRQAAVSNIKTISDDMLPIIEKLLTDSSYVVVKMTLEKLSASFPENNSKYLATTDKVYGIGNSVRCKWLELKAQEFGDKKVAIYELVDMTSQSFEFQTRKNAAEALKHLNYCDKNVAANLLDAMCSSNTRLAGPMGAVFSYFYDNNEYKKLFRTAYAAKNWQPWQKEILDKLIK